MAGPAGRRGQSPLSTNPKLRAELMKVLGERLRESRFSTMTVLNSWPPRFAFVSSQAERTKYLAEALAAGKVTPKPTTGSGSVATTSSTTTTKKATTAKKADVTVSSKPYTAAGYYYDVALDFALGAQRDKFVPSPPTNTPSPALTDDEKAEWGRNWAKDLVNPKKDCVYHVRCKVTQMRFDPLIGGFRLKWVVPSGWRIIDGQPLTLYVEATSNPLCITRKVLSPNATIRNAAFVVKVLQLFP